ncbi:MAG: carbohydrate ABC transporter permease [Clostridia bacterium]|nr:carbohydrate ABC transporter permease [Clostridia bacterium]
MSRKVTNRRSWFPIVGFIVFLLFSVFLVIPMLWAMLTTFKTNVEFRTNMFGLPKHWEFSNYQTAIDNFKVQIQYGAGLRTVNLVGLLQNSFLYSIGGTFFFVACHYIVAYCTAKFPYKFSGFVYGFILTLMLVPISASQAATIDLLQTFGLYDNWPGFFFQRFGFTGMYFLILHESIKTTSREISEAAEIDGASNLRIMFSIVMPQMMGMLFTIFLITFIAQWNDYMFPLMYMPTHPTLAYGLYLYNNSGNNAIAASVPLRLSGCMIIFIPMLVIFMIFHDKMMGNLSYGGVKE